jgi:hypothetical protein
MLPGCTLLPDFGLFRIETWSVSIWNTPDRLRYLATGLRAP